MIESLKGLSWTKDSLNGNLWDFFSDGRFRLGDEIINVNGKSLRGLSMDEARSILSSYSSQVNYAFAIYIYLLL